jgi:hypothetical protein
MTSEKVISGKLRGVTTLVMISAVVAYSLSVGRPLLGVVGGGMILLSYIFGQTEENDPAAPEPDTETTTSADSNYSLVYGPIGTVQAAIPDGLEDYTAEWVLYATDRRFSTVEMKLASDPPSHIEGLRNIAETLGYGKEVVPGNHYAEPPEEVLSEVKRQVRKDIDAGKVMTESKETRVSSSEEDSAKIGFCELEADEEEGGFRYSVSYDSRYFDWEADSTVETDGFSVSG